jgi:predicted secreted hydrolase
MNLVSQHNVSHVSLADHQLQKNYTTQKRTAGGGSDSGIQNSFLFNHSGWLMSGNNRTDQLKVNSDQFDFDLIASRPPILHGNNGKQLMNTGTLTRDSITEI